MLKDTQRCSSPYMLTVSRVEGGILTFSLSRKCSAMVHVLNRFRTRLRCASVVRILEYCEG